MDIQAVKGYLYHPIVEPLIAFGVFYLIGSSSSIAKKCLSVIPTVGSILPVFVTGLVILTLAFALLEVLRDGAKFETQLLKRILWKKALPHTLLLTILSLDEAYIQVEHVLGRVFDFKLITKSGTTLCPTMTGVTLHALVFAVLTYWIDTPVIA